MAEQSPRVFTLEEANALVPRLRELVGRQLTRASDIQELVAQLYRRNARRASARSATVGERATGERAEVVDITIHPGDSGEVRALKRALAARIEEYRSGWREVEALGAVVKDPRIGLLDFYGQVDSRLVCLCWKFGEDAIDFFHELDAGFAGRKSLADVKKRLLN